MQPKRPLPPKASLYSKTLDDEPTEINLGRVSMDIKGNLSIDGKPLGNLTDKKRTLNKFYKYVAKKALKA